MDKGIRSHSQPTCPGCPRPPDASLFIDEFATYCTFELATPSNLQQALKQINTHSHACTQLNNSQRCQALTIQQQCSNQYLHLHLHLHLHQTTTSTMKSQLESNHTNTTQCRPNNLHPPLHILPHSCTKEISFTSSHQPFNGTQEIIGFVRICCLFYKDHDFYWGYGHGCCQCQSALFA